MDQKALLALLEERKFKELKEELGNMYPVDIAELLEEVDERQGEAYPELHELRALVSESLQE